MRRSVTLGAICLVVSIGFQSTSFAAKKVPYGVTLCKSDPSYECVKVTKNMTWESLFPDAEERLVVKKINRMNVRLKPHMTIAVPLKLTGLTRMDVAPMPTLTEPLGQRTIIFDPSIKAWGAYDENGQLVNWGAASGGKSYCPDVGRGCRTVTGEFSVYHKRGRGCKSSKYPIGKGGAPMPYCMFFHGGFAFHGSPNVPGYHASHGCVRMFVEDARWLNEEFVQFGDGKQTKVVVKPYSGKL